MEGTSDARKGKTSSLKSRRCKESWHKSPGRMESWQKFTDSPDACKIDVTSRGHTESSLKLTGNPVSARKVDGWSSSHSECWRKVPWTRKVDRSPHRGIESWLKDSWMHGSWQMVPRLHGKLTEVDEMTSSRTNLFGRSYRCTKCWWKLTEGPEDTRRDDGNWRKLPWMHGKLTECPTDARKVDASWRKVPQLHGELMEVHRRTCGRTYVWQ